MRLFISLSSGILTGSSQNLLFGLGGVAAILCLTLYACGAILYNAYVIF
jgi:hypothetical protein